MDVSFWPECRCLPDLLLQVSTAERTNRSNQDTGQYIKGASLSNTATKLTVPNLTFVYLASYSTIYQHVFRN